MSHVALTNAVRRSYKTVVETWRQDTSSETSLKSEDNNEADVNTFSNKIQA
jgi:hypothetical protein